MGIRRDAGSPPVGHARRRSRPPVSGRLIHFLDRLIWAAIAGWPLLYSFGPLRLGPSTLSFGWPAGAAVVAGLVVARHALQPRPSLVAAVAARLEGLPAAGRTLTVAAATRGAVYITAAIAVLLVPYPTANFYEGDSLFWGGQARWDVNWYYEVARYGYAWDPEDADRQQNLAFFPAMPLLIRVAGDLVTIPAYLVGDPDLFGSTSKARMVLGGTIVALGAFAAAMVLLFRVAAWHLPSDRVGWAVVLAACHPFGVFFGVPYTESLFLLGCLGAMVAIRHGRYGAAGLWGLALGLTRPNAWFVMPALAVLLGERWARTGRPAARGWLMASAAVLAPAGGLLIHMAYLHLAVGDAFAFVRAQEAWQEATGWSAFVSERAIHLDEEGWAGYVAAYPYEFVNTVALLVALALAWPARRLSWAYTVLIVSYLGPAILLNIPSLGRMTAPLFPTSLALAALVPRRWLPAVAVASLLLQLWGAWQFYSWKPPF